jgi:hypothetical protein
MGFLSRWLVRAPGEMCDGGDELGDVVTHLQFLR